MSRVVFKRLPNLIGVAKLWKGAGERLLGRWTWLKHFRGRFGASFQLFISLFVLDPFFGHFFPIPEGPARQIDVSGQKLSPHCLETIFDSHLPSQPNRLLKCLPNCLSPTGEGIFSSFKITPAVRVIARQFLCLAGPTGISGLRSVHGNQDRQRLLN